MGRGSYKAAKGLIKVDVKVREDKIKEIHISGDFFMYPEDSLWELEQALLGASARREEILSRVRGFYQKINLLTPGVVPEDFTEAIIRGMNNVTS